MLNSSTEDSSELSRRIWFTLGALVVYRLGTYIPLPGIDPLILSEIVKSQTGGLLDVLDMFSGGALGRMSIFALAVMPYVTASIVVRLLAVLLPSLQDQDRARRDTCWGTLVLAAVQAYGIAAGLEVSGAGGRIGSPVIDPGLFFRVTTVSTLTGGAMFLVWLGDQVTARGIGNGVVFIIFAGIVARMPSALVQLLELGRTGSLQPAVIILFLTGVVAVMAVIVFVERARRRILVQYPKRQIGDRMFGGETSYLPVKLNSSGVIPPIVASALLLLPSTISNFAPSESVLGEIKLCLQPGSLLHMSLYAALIVVFCFLYARVVFNPAETAESLRRHYGFIPGITPGKNTADYLDGVPTRLTVVGAIYLAGLCVLPEYLISEFSLPFYFGRTSLLIVVCFIMDATAEIHARLQAQRRGGRWR